MLYLAYQKLLQLVKKPVMTSPAPTGRMFAIIFFYESVHVGPIYTLEAGTWFKMLDEYNLCVCSKMFMN